MTKQPLIKPSHRGLLHKELGVPQGQKIGAKKLHAAEKHASPAEEKRIVFAENFNHATHLAPGHPKMHTSSHH